MQSASSKKQYLTPNLVVYGDVRALTENLQVNNPNGDGAIDPTNGTILKTGNILGNLGG
jgi:hypothetical protein